MAETSFLSWLDSIGYSVAWILISIVWQSSIILIVSLAVSFALRKWNPSLRHTLLAAAILLIPMLPILAKAYVNYGSPKIFLRILPPYYSIEAPGERSGENAQQPVNPADGNRQSGRDESVEGRPAAVDDGPQVSIKTNVSDFGSVFKKIPSYPWAVLLILYTAGAFLFLMFIIIGRIKLESLYRTCTPVTDERILSVFRKARVDLGMDRNFIIVESDDASAPMTAGTSHPVIFMPFGLIDTLNDDELYAIALHELSHVRRNDPLVLTVVSVVRAVLFFHPLVWLASRKISLLAEHACDDAVIDSTKTPLNYARLLTKIAESVPKWSFKPELANGIVINKSVFLRRVEAILSDRRDQIRKLSRIALSSSAMAFLLSIVVAVAVPLSVSQHHFENSSYVTGAVYYGKEPVADADIYIISTDGFTRYDAGKEGETDKKGFFRIHYTKTMHDKLMFLVCSSKSGYFGWQTLDGSSRENIHMNLEKTRSIKGTVSDQNGEPVENAAVYISTIRYGGETSLVKNVIVINGTLPGTTARTGQDGGFLLESAPTEALLSIVVSAPGCGQKLIRGVNSYGSTLNITLMPECTISGSLDLTGIDTPPEDINIIAYPAENLRGLLHFGKARVSADGSFSIGQLSEGSYLLFPENPTAPDSLVFPSSSPQRLSSGQNITDVVLKPVLCSTLTGKVTMKGSGEAVAGMTVSVISNKLSKPLFTTATTSSGGYSIQVPNIPAELVLSPPDSCAESYISRQVDTSSQQYTGMMDFTLERGIDIYGTTRTVEGETVPGALVEYGLYSRKTSWSDSQGNFVLKGMKNGDTVGIYTTERSAGLKTSKKFEVDESRHLGLILEPYRTTQRKGRITDSDGNPLAGKNIFLDSFDSELKTGVGTITAVSDENGEFIISGLIVGEEYSIHEELTTITKQEFIAEEFMEPVALVYTADTLSIKGAVVDTEGNPVKDMIIHVQGSKTGLKMTQTDENGAFAFNDLASAVENIYLNHGMYGMYNHEFLLTGRNYTFTVMRSDKSISGIVTDTDGNPLSNARLRVIQSDDEKKLCKIDYGRSSGIDGRFSISNLSYENVDIEVRHHLFGVKVFTAIGTGTEDITLTMERNSLMQAEPVSIKDTPCGATLLESGHTITIDGSLDDWKGLPEDSSDILYYDPSVAEYTNFAPSSGTEDISARFRCASDNESFFIAFSINDDDTSYYDYASEGNWGNEMIELLFYGNENEIEDGRLKAKGKLWVSFFADNSVRLEGRDPISNENYPNLWASLGVRTAKRLTPQGRNVEISIPWKILHWSGWRKDMPNRLNIRLYDRDEDDKFLKCIEWAALPDEDYGWITLSGASEPANARSGKTENRDLPEKLYAILNSIKNTNWEVAESMLETIDDKNLSLPMMATVYKKAKNDDAYLRTLHELLAIKNRNKTTDYWLLSSVNQEARYFIVRGRYDDALALLVPAAAINQINAGHYTACFNLGLNYLMMQRFNKAEEVISAISTDDIHDYFVEEHGIFKRYDQILASIRQATGKR